MIHIAGIKTHWLISQNIYVIVYTCLALPTYAARITVELLLVHIVVETTHAAEIATKLHRAFGTLLLNLETDISKQHRQNGYFQLNCTHMNLNV